MGFNALKRPFASVMIHSKDGPWKQENKEWLALNKMKLAEVRGSRVEKGNKLLDK